MEPQKMAANYATLVRVPEGKEAKVDMEKAKIKIKAGGNNTGETGNVRNEAMLVDGNVDLKAKEGEVEIGTGVGEDKAIMDFAALLKADRKVLPNVSWDEIKAFVRELKDPFGVLCEDDLKEVELEELKNNIKCLKGVQLKKFLNYVQGLKEQQTK